MRIKKLQIDGFGIFSDTQIDGFTQGINVIYGENEFGKTTMLEFVRRILFGFPGKKNNVNMYPAVNGGNYGGVIWCELDDGRAAMISRHGLSKGGNVRLECDGNIIQGQHELDALLNTSASFFRNVYAITIEEIQQLGSLEGEDVRNRIYGAGLELGSVSPEDLRKTFSARAEEIFKTRGQIQLMPLKYKELSDIRSRVREARAELPQYLEKSVLLEKLEIDSVALTTAVEAMSRKIRELERRRELFNDYVEVEHFSSKLQGIPNIVKLPENIFAGLEKLKAELENIEGELKENSIEHAAATENLKNIKPDIALLERRGEIIALQKKSGIYSAALKDAEILERRCRELTAKINADTLALGCGWEAEDVENFNISVVQQQRATETRERLNTLREELKQVEFKRRHDVELRRRELEQNRSHGRKRSLIFALLVIATGVTAILAGLFSSHILTGFGAFTLLVGIVDFMVHFRSGTMPELAYDGLGSIYEDELNDLLKARSEWDEKWIRLLKELRFPLNIGVNDFDALASAAGKIRDDYHLLAEKQEELELKRRIVGDIKSEHDRLIGLLRAIPSGEVVTNIEILEHELEQNEIANTKMLALRENIENFSARATKLEQQREEILKKISDFFASFGVENEHQLKLLQEKSMERQGIENQLEVLSGRMKKIVGAGSSFNDFMDGLKQTDPLILEDEIENLKAELKDKNAALNTLRETVGRLKSEMDALASHDQLIKLRNAEESCLREFNDLAREWSVNIIAIRALEKAVEKYERERQPGVITRASEVFAHISGGRYPSIFRPVDAAALMVRDDKGRPVNVAELSRGTREELYLSMRLGLIAEYETRSESMPLIMDDVMVNFDDERRRRAISTLSEFARKRQLIVMTCSKPLLEEYLEAGAVQINV
ncbi:MAG: AAA family ATPase [Victivallales bacterium]|nr:AAA family ATPase [Victivallales bacterium]